MIYKVGTTAQSQQILTQPRHTGRARSGRRPVEAAVLLGELHIIVAGLAPAHQAVRVELPMLIAIGAVSLTVGIVPLILETQRDAIGLERPEVLDQAIVQFGRPFAREKGDNGGSALEKFRAMAPAAVLRIGERNALGIARVPGVFAMRAYWAAVSFVNGGGGRDMTILAVREMRRSIDATPRVDGRSSIGR